MSDQVDVIIPTYNRCELLLARALPSVLAQTHKLVRIFVMIHGSTDDTENALRKRYLANPRVCWRIVSRSQTYPPTAENHWFAGPVAPLNAGLDRVYGNWIARIDDDDEWTSDHLESLLDFAKSANYEFVSSAHTTDVGKVGPYILADGTKVGGCQTWLYRSYLRFFRYNPDCWRKSWNRVNDCDLQDRMWRAGVRMGYLDKITCIVKPRPGTDCIGLAAYTQNRDSVERTYAF